MCARARVRARDSRPSPAASALTPPPLRPPASPLQEEFVITIPDAEAEKILSAEDAIAFIAAHPNAK